MRSSIRCDVVEYMAGVEHTDTWLFESLLRIEEKKLRGPDDVYYLVASGKRSGPNKVFLRSFVFSTRMNPTTNKRTKQSDRELA